MNLVEKTVQDLSEDERIAILRSYSQLKKDGMIGDCLLRSTAEKLMGQMGGAGGPILWMDMLATECYRAFAQRYLRETYGIVI